MPIFARAKLVLRDYCMYPQKDLFLTYEGPNAHLVYPQIITFIKESFGVTERDIQPFTFEWERGKVEKFKVEWRVNKDIDKFSYFRIRIRMSGEIRPSEKFGKEGKISMRLRGELLTEYPQDTWWERSMVYEIIRTLWHRIFYRQKRWEYREVCKEAMMTFHNRVKEFFNLLPQKV